MLHIIKRCKHCYKTYNYQASGVGCHRPENNEDYCPECYAKILEALKDTPRLFEDRFNPKPLEKDDSLWNRIENALNKYFVKYFITNIQVCDLVKSIKEEEPVIKFVVIQNIKYAVQLDNDNKIINVYRLEEYDLINQRFTGSTWEKQDIYLTKNEDYYCGDMYYCNFHIKIDDVPVVGLSEPTANIFFFDFKK